MQPHSVPTDKATRVDAWAGELDGVRWEAVQTALKEAVGDEDYTAWLSHLTPQHIDADGLTLSVPTSFMQQWIDANFKHLVAEKVEAEIGTAMPVFLKVSPAFSLPARAAEAAPVPPPEVVAEEGAAAQLESARLDPRYTFDAFVTGKSNQFAFAAAQRVAQEGGFNPFFIHGGVGLGKTHLMHAIGWEIARTKPDAKILYLSSEQFLYRFIRALRDRNTLGFKDMFRSVDVLMIDDIQFIAGKEATQEEFFHTFNTLTNLGKQVILSADRSPHELPNIEERLKSRLGSGLTVEVHPPEMETRMAILQKKADDLQLSLSEDVLELLAQTIASNVRELEGALNRLVASSRLLGSEISTEFAREQLADLFRLHTRVATVDDIQKQVADYFKVRIADMHSPRRTRALARPRQVAMYLCKQLTTRSYPDIGRAFGGRDHTTVIHGVEMIEALMEKDPELAEHVRLLMKMLGGK